MLCNCNASEEADAAITEVQISAETMHILTTVIVYTIKILKNQATRE